MLRNYFLRYLSKMKIRFRADYDICLYQYTTSVTYFSVFLRLRNAPCPFLLVYLFLPGGRGKQGKNGTIF